MNCQKNNLFVEGNQSIFCASFKFRGERLNIGKNMLFTEGEISAKI